MSCCRIDLTWLCPSAILVYKSVDVGPTNLLNFLKDLGG